MINETIITTPNVTDNCAFKRICWTAIFVGATVGIGVSFLFALFGTAIGLSIFSMGANGALTFAVGGLIGIIICIIVSMLVAGYAAGYLGRLYCPQRNLGILYGFCAWTVALMLSALLISQMSAYITTSSNATMPQVSEASATPQVESATNTSNVTTNTAPNTTITAMSPLTVQTDASPSANSNHAITINAAPDVLAWGAFIIFGLFFIGALFSCIGGCWGMSCKRED